MAVTAQFHKNPSATSDVGNFSRPQDFYTVDSISDDDSDETSSADQHRGWEEPDMRKFIGVDGHYQAIFRPSPRTSAEVRKHLSSTNKLVEWEGVVESVSVDIFEARLTVIKGSNVDFDEFASFELANIPQDDQDLIRLGALFRFVVGLQALGGTRQQYSRLTFRRLPAWNNNTIDKTQSKFENIVKSIVWSDEAPSAD